MRFSSKAAIVLCTGVAAVGLKRPHATLFEPQTAPRSIRTAVRRQARRSASLSSAACRTLRAHCWKSARREKLAHGHWSSVSVRSVAIAR